MKNKMAFAALFAGALFMVGCGQQDKEANKPAAQAAAAPAALPVPPSGDTQAWKQYLVNVAKRNLEGIRNSPYMYYLPAADAADFDEQYTRQLDNVAGSVARGVLPGQPAQISTTWTPPSLPAGDYTVHLAWVRQPALAGLAQTLRWNMQGVEADGSARLATLRK